MVPHDESSNHDRVAPDHAGFQPAGPPSSAAAGNHLHLKEHAFPFSVRKAPLDIMGVLVSNPDERAVDGSEGCS